MGIDDKADNKAEELKGKGKATSVTRQRQGFGGQGPSRAGEGKSEAGRREGKGRVQELVELRVGFGPTTEPDSLGPTGVCCRSGLVDLVDGSGQ